MDHLEIRQTLDQSPTLYSSLYKTTYHSMHGAVQESQCVFIDLGWVHFQSEPSIRIFEMGFGTGLNAWLTWQQILTTEQRVSYHAIEKHPIPIELAQKLPYTNQSLKENPTFLDLHSAPWEEPIPLDDQFTLFKNAGDIQEVKYQPPYDLIYYDAFGPGTQPELWTEEALTPLISALRLGGVLVTYCSQGQFRRNLQALNMQVTKQPGPPGKREIVFAIKV